MVRSSTRLDTPRSWCPPKWTRARRGEPGLGCNPRCRLAKVHGGGWGSGWHRTCFEAGWEDRAVFVDHVQLRVFLHNPSFGYYDAGAQEAAAFFDPATGREVE